MLTSKLNQLKSLIESKDGVHLTIYLVNRGDVADLKSQVRKSIHEAAFWLNPVMTESEKKKFLEPLNALLSDAKIFKQMKGNIGIFRSKDLFRVLNIPIGIVYTCQVATSFHVKPLLRWLQGDQDFLLLGLEADSAHLYLGSQDSLRKIDSIIFPDFFKKKYGGDYTSLKTARKNKSKEIETYEWLNNWICTLTASMKPKLFLAGSASLVEPFQNTLKYRHAVKKPISNQFEAKNFSEICQQVRKILREEARTSFENILQEFRFAHAGNRAKKNIFQISKAVVQGQVRKLIVTDDFSIFGKIDPKTGGLAIHPLDLDHEDDCILDDLAQMVLSKGGVVVVAKKDEIPKGRPILAILDDDDKSLAKRDNYQLDFKAEKLA